MPKPMMLCGHAANATNKEGKPVCVICIGIISGAEDINPEQIAKGRMAYCSYCNKERPSSSDLPFFGKGYIHHGVRDETKDSFYCGCLGWD